MVGGGSGPQGAEESQEAMGPFCSFEGRDGRWYSSVRAVPGGRMRREHAPASDVRSALPLASSSRIGLVRTAGPAVLLVLLAGSSALPRNGGARPLLEPLEQFDLGSDLQLLVDRAQMIPDRAGGEAELLGDGGHPGAGAEADDDLPLAAGEKRQARHLAQGRGIAGGHRHRRDPNFVGYAFQQLPDVLLAVGARRRAWPGTKGE